VNGDGGKAPLRQRLKEWGEVADVWTKIVFRLGLLGVGIGSGDGLVHILQKATGG
jgi:hypothetical protein